MHCFVNCLVKHDFFYLFLSQTRSLWITIFWWMFDRSVWFLVQQMYLKIIRYIVELPMHANQVQINLAGHLILAWYKYCTFLSLARRLQWISQQICLFYRSRKTFSTIYWSNNVNEKTHPSRYVQTTILYYHANELPVRKPNDLSTTPKRRRKARYCYECIGMHTV